MHTPGDHSNITEFKGWILDIGRRYSFRKLGVDLKDIHFDYEQVNLGYHIGLSHHLGFEMYQSHTI